MSKRFHESYTDTYVAPGKKLTYGSDRLAYIVEPVIDPELLKPETRDFMKNLEFMSSHKKAALDIDRICNKLVYTKVSTLKDNELIVIEGESHDFAEESYTKFGTDFMARICMTSDQILDINNKIAINNRHKKEVIAALENIVYFQFSPYLYAFYNIRFEDDKKSVFPRQIPVMHFCFEEQMKNATEIVQSKNKDKRGFEPVEKTLNDNTPMTGIFNYAPSVLYDTSIANRLEYDVGFILENWSVISEEVKEKLSPYDLRELLKDESLTPELRKLQPDIDSVKEIVRPYRPEIISKSTGINRDLQKAMFESAVLRQIGTKPVYVFARESCYLRNILDRIEYPFVYTRPVRATKIKRKGINEESAKNILESTIKKAGGIE